MGLKLIFKHPLGAAPCGCPEHEAGKHRGLLLHYIPKYMDGYLTAQFLTVLRAFHVFPDLTEKKLPVSVSELFLIMKTKFYFSFVNKQAKFAGFRNGCFHQDNFF